LLTVCVPATTANLGPGFDTLGLALDIYNTVTVKSSTRFSLTVKGEGEDSLPADESNLLFRAARAVFDRARINPGHLSWSMENRIPLKSGLGSSAAAIVAGLSLGNALIPSPFSSDEIHRLAVELEGHPDNVTPALYGGLTVSINTGEGPRLIKAGVPSGLNLAVAVPVDYTLSTKKSREVLPAMVKHEDAIFNLGRTAILLTALFSRQGEYLKWACQDKLHQPYRAGMVPGWEKVMAAAQRAGAQGVALSGAGPAVAAFWIEEETKSVDCPGENKTSSVFSLVARSMQDALAETGVACRVFKAKPDGRGARLEVEK